MGERVRGGNNIKPLLAIIEQGGYPDFRSLYEAAGYQVTVLHSMRKAMSHIKKHAPAVIVAEFNYQSDFRDRTSSLESMLATVEQITRKRADSHIKVIVFYEREYQSQLDKLKSVFSNFTELTYPIDSSRLTELLV